MRIDKLLVVLSVGIFSSCAEAPVETEVQKVPVVESQPELNVVEVSDEEIIQEIDSIQVYSLLDFPKDWLNLTDTIGNGENLFIQEYCDAEVPSIHFVNHDKDYWEIRFDYGQESQLCSLHEFNATISEVELMQVVVGSIRYSISGMEEEVQTMNFTWNMDEKFCSFSGGAFSGKHFVSVENQENYPTISPNCDDHWD